MSLQFDSDSDDDGMSDISPEVAALQEKVFHNENILEQIFQFMSIEDLASTRLVCKKWKSESDRILRIRQPLIVLRTKTDIQRITELLDKGRTLSSVPVFKNFLILFEQIHLEQKEVAEFLNNHGPSFEQLSIQFDWHLPATQNTPQSFKYLLEKQVPNLKSIFFFGFSEELWQSGELFNDSVNLLPNLKHIGCITVNNYRHAWECPLYLSLFNRLSSVKKITINCSNYWDILFTQAETSNDNQLRRFFSNVEEINTGFYDDKILARVRLVEDRQPINVPNVLKSLPQLCPKVKILRLWFNSHNIYKRHVGGLLGKYAEQLEVLWLNVINYKFSEEEIEDVEMEANPTYLINELLASSVFKKLRVLRTSIDILQPPNAVNQFFHQQLPALESLSLLYKMSLLAWNPDFKYSRLRKLELLVGNPEHLEPIGQAFPNLKILNIKLNGNAVLQAVPRVFPNLEELYVACYTSHLTNIGITCVLNLRQLRLLIMEDFGENYIRFLKNMKFSPFDHLPFVPPLKVPAELLNKMKAQNRLVRPVT